MKTITLAIFAGICIMSVGCGGGSSNKSNTSANTNTAPNVSITSPSNNSLHTDVSTINLSASANDSEDGDISSNIRWSSDVDGEIGLGRSINTSLTSGNHVISATVADSGNTTASTSLNVRINTSPTISITSPQNSGNQSEDLSVEFSATASDAEDGEISSLIQWSSDIDGNLGNGGQLSILLTPGNHQISATIADSDNISNSQNISYKVNASYGIATLSWVAPTENTDNSELTDLAGFRIYYGITGTDLDNVLIIDSPDVLSAVIEQLPTENTYFFAITAVNELGIESDLSEIVFKFVPS